MAWKRRAETDDPIEEDDSDVVVAVSDMTISDRNRTPQAQSRYNHRNSIFNTQQRDFQSNLPPRTNGSHSSTIKATPIAIRHEASKSLERDADRNGYGMSTTKMKSVSKHKGFIPYNTLDGRRQPLKPLSARSHELPWTLNRKRKFVDDLDESEDELAGPGAQKLSHRSSPKRMQISPTREGSVPEYQRIQQLSNPRSKRVKDAPDEDRSSGKSIQVLTQKQLRDQKRQQTIAQNKYRSSETLETISPHFTRRPAKIGDAMLAAQGSANRKTKLRERLRDADGTVYSLHSSSNDHAKTRRKPPSRSSDPAPELDTVNEINLPEDFQDHASLTSKTGLNVHNDHIQTTPNRKSSGNNAAADEDVYSGRIARSTRSSKVCVDTNEPEITASVEKYSKIHGLGVPWENSLTYPKTGKNRVTVEFNDLERLDEGEFLNDNLVEFAFRWLRHKARDSPEIYWFNTYFFEKLTNGKGKKIDYDGVKTWTKNVNLFDYKYVIVPINENLHWYLAIICNLSALKKVADAEKIDAEIGTTAGAAPLGKGQKDTHRSIYNGSMEVDQPEISYGDGFMPVSKLEIERNDEPEELQNRSLKPKSRVRHPSLPTIVTLDSLGFSHHSAISVLKAYLKKEAEARYHFDWEKDDLAGMTAKGIPCQSNWSDCGLYMLGYVETMLQNPSEFISKLLLKELDETKDWEGLDPRYMRDRLRKVIVREYHRQVGLVTPRKLRRMPDDFSDSSSDGLMFRTRKSSPWMKRVSHAVSVEEDELLSGHESKHSRLISSPSASAQRNNTVEKHEKHVGPSKTPPDYSASLDRALAPIKSSTSHRIPVKKYRESGRTLEDREILETPQSTPELKKVELRKLDEHTSLDDDMQQQNPTNFTQRTQKVFQSFFKDRVKP